MFPFVKSDFAISPNFRITVIDIDDLSDEVRKVIDDNFVSICEGNSGTELIVVKKYVVDLFSSKNNDWIMGATAEFFVHLYMKLSGFKQEFLYLNLEEGSIKKGFDGYYSLGNEEWLMESKSGYINTKGVSHKNKVKEAMKDLELKVGGKDKKGKKAPNNPWRNAYLHASLYDVGTADAIRKNIKALSDDFTIGVYRSIEKFNTMPCGTIFLSGIWNPQKTHVEIMEDIKTLAEDLKGTKIHVVCVTQKSIDLFQEYIKQGVL